MLDNGLGDKGTIYPLPRDAIHDFLEKKDIAKDEDKSICLAIHICADLKHTPLGRWDSGKILHIANLDSLHDLSL